MKENIMKYNIEPITGLSEKEKVQFLNGVTRDDFDKLDFMKEATAQLVLFQGACNAAYTRFQINKDKPKAELTFHKEIKKYRKVFNHNIQDITKKYKFEKIEKVLGRIKEYQIN